MALLLSPNRMNYGLLSDHFVGAGWKRLTAHEVDPAVSHGHEFQGVARLRSLLGDDSRELSATFLVLPDDDDAKVKLDGIVKWYDARRQDRSRSPEWRLYYREDSDGFLSAVREGDLVVFALTKAQRLVVLFSPRNASSEAQLLSLFDIPDADAAPGVRKFTSADQLSSIAARLLQELGLADVAPSEVGDGEKVRELAAELSRDFPTKLPTGATIAARIQGALSDVDPRGDPDGTLVRWIEAEAATFRLWEDGLIGRRLEAGFLADGKPDVQSFRDFSMTIRQSRVSRAGRALQFHIAALLQAHQLGFTAQGRTESGEIPDFLLPGQAEYDDLSFPASALFMLAAKYTAKDRWRQVLNEAHRIPRKHLLTLEAPISLPQLQAMTASSLQPVIPAPYHAVFAAPAKALIIPLGAFIAEVAERQKK